MPKKKEEPEVAAAVETTESAAEVTDIEPVPVEPAAEVSAEPIEPAAEEPPKPKRTRKKKPPQRIGRISRRQILF